MMCTYLSQWNPSRSINPVEGCAAEISCKQTNVVCIQCFLPIHVILQRICAVCLKWTCLKNTRQK